MSSSNSCIRTRPGLAQSFGCVLSGSMVSWRSCLEGVDESMERTAISMFHASGLGTARDFVTRRPSFRVRVESKYIG